GTVADRVTIAFGILAKPAPYVMRAFAVAAIVLTIAASTSVVSSGSVSDDALYSVKLASEQARLALATTPEDRAMVELTIAEHRLAEATELATQGNDDDAIVATSEYGAHLANAAAELAQVETLTPDAQGLVVQLQQKIDTHRTTKGDTERALDWRARRVERDEGRRWSESRRKEGKRRKPPPADADPPSPLTLYRIAP